MSRDAHPRIPSYDSAILSAVRLATSRSALHRPEEGIKWQMTGDCVDYTVGSNLKWF